MFDNLSEKLGGILDRLTRRGALSEADVDAAMREVRRALLEADVALDVVRSFTENGNEDSLSRWRATFTGKDLPDFEVEIDTASTACVFSVLRETTRETVNVIRQPSPFSTGQVTTKPGSLDGRVDTLINFCQSAWSDQVIMPEFYRHTILLWKELEHVEHCNHSVRFAA